MILTHLGPLAHGLAHAPLLSAVRSHDAAGIRQAMKTLRRPPDEAWTLVIQGEPGPRMHAAIVELVVADSRAVERLSADFSRERLKRRLPEDFWDKVLAGDHSPDMEKAVILLGRYTREARGQLLDRLGALPASSKKERLALAVLTS